MDYLSSITKPRLAVTPTAAGTATYTGTTFDTAGYEGVMFVFLFGSPAANNIAHVQGSATDAAGSDLLGTAVLSTAEGGTEEVVIIDIKHPAFRYLTPVMITGTSSTVACTAILYGARAVPVDNNVAGTVTLEQHLAPAAGSI